MALRVARIRGIDFDKNGRWILYDSVTMYVYPMTFQSEDEIDMFCEWFYRTHGVPVNGFDGNHFAEYEKWQTKDKDVPR